MITHVKIFSCIISVLLFINATFTNNLNQNSSYSERFIAADSTIKTDSTTGLIVAEGLDLVTAHCTGCHSAKLITQFHTDKKGWLEKIRWMQQKQKLWDLGEAEPVILDYLAKNYPPTNKINRRESLKIANWYNLQKQEK